MNRWIGAVATLLLPCLLSVLPFDGARAAVSAIEPPPPPQITAPLPGSTFVQPGVTIVGTAQSNSAVTLILDNVVAGGVPADGAGNWQLALYLADGVHEVKAYATNAAGRGGDSPTVSFLVADGIFNSDFEIHDRIFANGFDVP